MLPYLLVMGAVVMLGLFAPHRFGWGSRITAFSLLLVFCGGRFEVGSDWFSYIIFYEYVLTFPTDLGFFSEPSFSVLCRVSDYLGLGITGVNFAAAAIYLVGLFLVAAKTQSPWCAIAAALCYYIPALPMGIIRQGAAIGIIFTMIANWTKMKDSQRAIIVILAMTFHLSAVVMLGVVLAASRIKVWQRLAVGFLILVVAIIFNFDPSNYFSTYNDRYIEGINGVVIETTAAQFHWILIAGPSTLYLIFRKHFGAEWLDKDLMTISSLVSIALIALLPFSSTAVTRLAMYFSFMPVIVCGMIANISLEKLNQTVLRTAVLSGTSVIFIIWLLFAENSKNYIPYHSIIL